MAYNGTIKCCLQKNNETYHERTGLWHCLREMKGIACPHNDDDCNCETYLESLSKPREKSSKCCNRHGERVESGDDVGCGLRGHRACPKNNPECDCLELWGSEAVRPTTPTAPTSVKCCCKEGILMTGTIMNCTERAPDAQTCRNWGCFPQ